MRKIKTKETWFKGDLRNRDGSIGFSSVIQRTVV